MGTFHSRNKNKEDEKERDEPEEELQANVHRGIPENVSSWVGVHCFRPDVSPVRERERDARGRKTKVNVSWDDARKKKKSQTKPQAPSNGGTRTRPKQSDSHQQARKNPSAQETGLATLHRVFFARLRADSPSGLDLSPYVGANDKSRPTHRQSERRTHTCGLDRKPVIHCSHSRNLCQKGTLRESIVPANQQHTCHCLNDDEHNHIPDKLREYSAKWSVVNKTSHANATVVDDKRCRSREAGNTSLPTTERNTAQEQRHEDFSVREPVGTCLNRNNDHAVDELLIARIKYRTENESDKTSKELIHCGRIEPLKLDLEPRTATFDGLATTREIETATPLLQTPQNSDRWHRQAIREF